MKGVMAVLVLVTVQVGALQRAAAQDVSLPVVNHLVIVLDSASMQQIAVAAFLTEQFAGSVVADGGASFYGKHTYLKLLGPRDADGRAVGDAGVVMAIEQSGGVNTLRVRLLQLHAVFDTGKELQGVAATSVPGFRWIKPAGADSLSSHFGMSVIEFSDEAATMRGRIDSLSHDNRTSTRFIGTRFRPDRLMRDVTGATLAIPAADIAIAVRFARNAGVRAVVEGEQAIIYFDNFTLRLAPPWRGAGVKRLEFVLTRDVPANPVYRFGPHSRLRFGPGAVATWDFESQ